MLTLFHQEYIFIFTVAQRCWVAVKKLFDSTGKERKTRIRLVPPFFPRVVIRRGTARTRTETQLFLIVERTASNSVRNRKGYGFRFLVVWILAPSGAGDNHGEFDPGSERTLAARLKHASRTARKGLAPSLEWRTGE